MAAATQSKIVPATTSNISHYSIRNIAVSISNIEILFLQWKASA